VNGQMDVCLGQTKNRMVEKPKKKSKKVFDLSETVQINQN
jgi:hypothetical protein